MADFVSILKSAIDRQGTPSAEIRARIYDRAREAVGARSQTRSPSEIEAYRRSLEAVIGEVECFYEVLAETTLQITQPMPSSDGCSLETQSSSPGLVGDSKTHVAPRNIVALEVAGAQNSESCPATAAEMYEPLDAFWHFPDRVSQTHSYRLEWQASSACSICHKWAMCIDSDHCWNRD